MELTPAKKVPTERNHHESRSFGTLGRELIMGLKEQTPTPRFATAGRVWQPESGLARYDAAMGYHRA
jgi:hypothetical protein